MGYLILGFYLRYETLDIARFNEWLTRDFDRAYNLINGIYVPLAGPETTGGGRLPGPLLYFLLAIPLIFQKSYESIYFFHFLINSGSLLLIFFTVKRYFGFKEGVFSAIFLSIDLSHIDTVAFPINPSFIIPLLILFLGLILEFSVKRNTKVFPLMFLLITLAIQMHYSVATYYLIPITAALVFRIRIPFKTIALTLLIVSATFSSYWIHKATLFESENKIHKKFFNQEKISLAEVTKIIFAQNTLRRLSYQGAEPLFGASDFFLKSRFVLMNLTLYGFGIWLLVGWIKEKGAGKERETALFLLFYIPAIIYEVAAPHTHHVWYSYIFLPPILVMMARLIVVVYENNKNKIILFGFTAFTVSFLGYLTFFTFDRFHLIKGKIENRLKLGHPGLFYKNLNLFKLLVAHLFKELNLTPAEYSEKVFFEGMSPFSLNLLKEINVSNSEGEVSGNPANENKCFYIIKNTRVIEEFRNKFLLENRRLNAFLKDPTLNISGNIREIRFEYKHFAEYVLVFEYEPKEKQGCYNNSYGMFVVAKKLRDLLIQSRGMVVKDHPLAVKKELFDELYDSSNRLKSLNAEFVILDQELQTPIRLKIRLSEELDKKKLIFDLEFYSFVQNSKFIINVEELGIFIKKTKTPQKRNSSINDFILVQPGSWLSRYTTYYKDERYTNRLIYSKEFELSPELELEKDNFNFVLHWKMKFLAKNDSVPADGVYSKEIELR